MGLARLGFVLGQLFGIGPRELGQRCRSAGRPGQESIGRANSLGAGPTTNPGHEAPGRPDGWQSDVFTSWTSELIRLEKEELPINTTSCALDYLQPAQMSKIFFRTLMAKRMFPWDIRSLPVATGRCYEQQRCTGWMDGRSMCSRLSRMNRLSVVESISTWDAPRLFMSYHNCDLEVLFSY